MKSSSAEGVNLTKKRTRIAHEPVAVDLFKRPVYLCPELGRTCNRPGAYDAYDLPSIYAGARMPYRFSQLLPDAPTPDKGL